MNLQLAHDQFNIPISGAWTAIAHGTETDEGAADPRFAIRFDFGCYIGVAALPSCDKSVADYPFTNYGKGEQRRPFIALEDAVEGLPRPATDDPADRPDCSLSCPMYSQFCPHGYPNLLVVTTARATTRFVL